MATTKNTSKSKTKTKSGATGAKKASGTKRTTSSAKSKGAKKGGARRAPARRVDYRPRLIGGFLCFVLAIFSAFGYFGIHAVVINLLLNLERGLCGYGYWIAPIMLLWAAVVLILHGGMPVKARTTCALLTPFLVGGLVQCFSWGSQYDISPELFSSLWSTGIEMTSGGVISGFLTALLVKTLSKVGAVLVYLVLLCADLLVLTRTTPTDVVEYCKDKKQQRNERKALQDAQWEEYDEYEEETQTPQPQSLLPPIRKYQNRVAQQDIDIPVEGYVPESEQPRKKKAAEPKKTEPAPAPVQEPEFVQDSFRPEEPKPAPKKVGRMFDQFFGQDVPVEEPASDYVPERLIPDPPQPAPAVTQTPPVVSEPVPTVTLAEEARNKAEREKAEQAEANRQVAAELDEGMKSAEVYVYPEIDLLKTANGVPQDAAMGEIQETRAHLDDTIKSFGINAHVINAVRGPSVTRYELELERGVKLSKVTNLAGDLALTLGVMSVRIAPVPGKSSVVGVEVPNRLVTPVPIREVLDSNEFRSHKSNVAFAVGKDISGRNVVGDISRLPHLLIAGTTGSGKSVCTNSLIISLLYKASPDQVRMIMVDPKMVELSTYDGIPHLLIPVVTDPKKAAGALQWAVTEMLKRYRLFSERHVRELSSYNQQVENDMDTEEKPLPQIVVVIDELADLMLVAAKEVEDAICRLAQMGRAAGMHLIIATQRPSADVITGLMKANIPSRIAFSVSSGMESRIILDTQGAEKLVGKGDMLYFPVGSGKPQRVQGCFISDEEVNRVIGHIKSTSTSDYDDSVMQEVELNAQNAEKSGKKGNGGSAPDTGDDVSMGTMDDADPMINNAIDVVVELGMASVSVLQRRLKLGYSRAARLVDQMEERGVVGPFEGSKPRKVLITKQQWMEIKAKGGSLTDLDQASTISEEADAEQSIMAAELDEPPFDVE